MIKNKDKRILGVNVKLEEQLKKQLSFLNPKGASKRTIYTVPATLAKAYNDIYLTQEKFDSEREDLRSGLNTPIKLHNDKFQFFNNKTSVKSKSTPKLMNNSKFYRKIVMKSPTRRSVPKSTSRKDFINSFINSCSELKKANAEILKQIPSLKKKVKKETTKLRNFYEKIQDKNVKRQKKMEKMIFSQNL